MKKIIVLLVTLLLLTSIFALPCQAKDIEQVYDTYIYGNETDVGDGKPIEIPSVFTVEKVYDSKILGVGNLSDINDIFFDGKSFFICDSTNNRILEFDESWNLKKEIKGFENEGNIESFSNPSSCFSNGEQLVICDMNNGRIVILSLKDYSPVKVLNKPEIGALEDENGDYIYKPKKAVMDNAGRFYVIADGVNQGLIRLDSNGEFITFIGAPSVVPKFTELLWRKFATKEQKKQLEQFVPTEYDSLLIDEDGFVYATSKTSAKESFVRLNSKGENILPEIKYYGDSSQSTYDSEVSPYFVDIAVDEDGTCYLLDSNQGKIYAYDASGTMLFAFGANAFQQGAFYSASAIEYVNNRLYVIDQNKRTITKLCLTEFGEMIYKAKELYAESKYDDAKVAYIDVKEYCSSYLPATVAISYIDMQKGEYSNSLARLKQIRDYTNYSKVFVKVRNNIIRSYTIWIVLVVVVVIIAVLIFKKLSSKMGWFSRFNQSDSYIKYKYSNYVIFHPFDGFWDIKHEKKGNLKTALVILGMFTLLYGLRAQYSGYIITKNISSESNSILDCIMILIPLGCWVIANWCFTTLMDGKGTLKDILITTCYSLKPYVILSIPLLIMSHVLTAEEAMFYTVLNTVSIIWVLGLIFFGTITIHDYSLSKGIIATALSVIGICLIIFVAMLIISVGQNVVDYFLSIYRELMLRMYS